MKDNIIELNLAMFAFGHTKKGLKIERTIYILFQNNIYLTHKPLPNFFQHQKELLPEKLRYSVPVIEEPPRSKRMILREIKPTRKESRRKGSSNFSRHQSKSHIDESQISNFPSLKLIS